MKKIGKKEVSVRKKNFGSKTITEIEPWFRFPIPIPNFGLTLIFSKTDNIPSRSQLFPDELLSIAIRADRKWAGFLADKIGDQLILISKLKQYIISKCISQ